MEHFHESIMQDLDDTCSDMMSDFLVICRGAITAFDPLEVRERSEAAVQGKGSEQGGLQTATSGKSMPLWVGIHS